MREDNPYRVERDGKDREYAFSGGRSSAYMMHHVVEANGGLPPRSVCLFMNTGKEREETLDFVRRCAQEWGIPIIWLEYRYRADARGGRADPKHHYAVVDHATAARNGEPFRDMVLARRRLPNVVERSCTQELKRATADRYLRRTMKWAGFDKGAKSVVSVIGYRWDEPKRWGKDIYKECRQEYPMVHAHVMRADVERFWKGMPWDLQLQNSDWGNCDLCYLKGKGKISQFMRLEPERAQWWSALEAEVERMTNQKRARFSSRFGYGELAQAVAEDRQIEIDADEEVLPCFCTD